MTLYQLRVIVGKIMLWIGVLGIILTADAVDITYSLYSALITIVGYTLVRVPKYVRSDVYIRSRG